MKKIKETVLRLAASDKFWAAAIFIITFAVFSPSLFFREFIGDDLFYYNQLLSMQNSFLRIFDPVLKLRTPMTGFSLYIDYLIWGEKNFLSGAHLTNILLHCGNALLFFGLLRTIKWEKQHLPSVWAGMTALIFAIHPQRVESVAWMCERKDCLSMFLGLAALFFFLYDMRKDKISWKSGILLILSFLAKPMWLFFIVPAAALIWMEHRNFQWKFYLKHLFIPATLLLLYMLPLIPGLFQQIDVSSQNSGGLFLKIETIFFNYGNYFLRTFLPGNLFPLYPFFNPGSAPRWMAFIPVALLCTPLLARNKDMRSAIIFGVLPVLLCFAAVLIPTVGFLRVGNTDFADRYSYLPSIFLLAGAAFLLKFNIPAGSAFSRWLPILGILYCGGLIHKTELYLPVWKNNWNITKRSIEPQLPNYHASMDAAYYYYREKKFDKAISICREKLPELSHYPEYFKYNIQAFKLAIQGLILFESNKPDEGIRYLNTIYMSQLSNHVNNLPLDFIQKIFTTGASYHLAKYNNRKGAANLYFRCAILLKEHSAAYEAFYYGMMALAEENYTKAVRHFKRASSLNPHEPRIRQNLNYAIKKLETQKK